MLWLALTALAACAAALMAAPFLRSQPVAPPEAPAEPIDIYRAQLDDVAREEAAGEIDAAFAADMRTEIERRILEAPAPASRSDPVTAQHSGRLSAIATAGCVVLASVLLYAMTGSPNTPSAGPASAPDAASFESASPEERARLIADMVERLEQRLAEEPRSAEGWAMLMRSRMVLGQPERASAALTAALEAFEDDPTTQQQLRAFAAELEVPGA